MAKDLISEFVGAISTDTAEPNTTYDATVARVDSDGTVWVSVEGSNNETPTASVSSEAKKGDAVKVEWRNNKLYLAGNYTDPAAGVETVKAVEVKAGQAMDLADSAKADVKSVNQYFWHVKNGAERGAHITEVPQAVFSADPENGGGNLLATSSGIAVRDGLTELAVFGSSGVSIGQLLGYAMRMTQNQLEVIENNVIIGKILNDSTEGLTIKDESSQNRIYLGDGIGLVNDRDEGLVINSGDVTATGSIRDTVITATPTIARSSGGTLSAIVYKRSGNVAMLRFTVTDTTSVAAGANVFEGTLADGFRPATYAHGCGYYGTHSIIGVISPSGGIVIRNASSTAVTLSSGGVGIGFTYIIE